MILIQINSGFERKKRHNEYESDDTISDTKKSTFINADLIYCHKDYLQHHFCVFADKFKIAENNTFQCNDKYFNNANIRNNIYLICYKIFDSY